MARLVVTAAASPLFNNFLMLVSVSADADGTPVTGLKPTNFKIAHLASLNHASANPRDIDKVAEGPPGFYIVQLKPSTVQPNLPPGHYVFAVSVAVRPRTGDPSAGQTIATGDLPG